MSLKFYVTIVAVDHIYDAEMDSDFNLDKKPNHIEEI